MGSSAKTTQLSALPRDLSSHFIIVNQWCSSLAAISGLHPCCFLRILPRFWHQSNDTQKAVVWNIEKNCGRQRYECGHLATWWLFGLIPSLWHTCWRHRRRGNGQLQLLVRRFWGWFKKRHDGLEMPKFCSCFFSGEMLKTNYWMHQIHKYPKASLGLLYLLTFSWFFR